MSSSEWLNFRRTFSLLILLVVLPSAALSGFGVLAIINERAAVEKRLNEAWVGRLNALAKVLPGTLANLRAEVFRNDSLVLTTPDGSRASETPFLLRGGQVETTDARLRSTLTPLLDERPTFPPRPVYFSVASIQGTFLVAIVQKGTIALGARVNTALLEQALNESARSFEGMAGAVRFELRPVQREWAAEGPVERLLSGVADAREAALRTPELAGVSLDSPFQDFRLSAVPVGEDPIAQASFRNRAVYGVLLGLFYVTLALGVVYTGRALYREAQLSRLKTDFVSLVSHELKTPLTSIRMFIETLEMGRVKDEKETRDVLHLLSKETERLSQMIEQVLDWARIESGRKAYKTQRMDVSAVIDQAMVAFRAQRPGAPYSLQLESEPGLPTVDVDSGAMAGALLNLLQNAYKYTGDDKRIRVKARLEKGGVAIDVQDNGPGIPRKETKRIFERFYRVDGLLTRSTEGSGLGLSIAERIVKAHGGSISIRSEVGKGSTFTLFLPRARASTGEP